MNKRDFWKNNLETKLNNHDKCCKKNNKQQNLWEKQNMSNLETS